MRLNGHRILITGAAQGIGFAVTRSCLAEGAHVLATDLDSDALSETAKKLSGFDDSLRTHPMDIASQDSIDQAIDHISDWSDMSGLVNNAAMLDISDTASVTDETYSRVLDVNLTGALRVTRAALPKLLGAPNPSVVNTISTQAFFGVPHSVAYASAKGGLMMLTRSMAVDFGADGIRVNAVAPGFIDTRMALTEDGTHEHETSDFKSHYISAGRIPLRRPGTPEDCAGTFLFLLSDLSLYITGQAIFVDGGLSATY